MNQAIFRFDLAIAKRILHVSFPLMGSMVGNLLMILIDRICLARYSSDTLAASGPAIFTATTIFTVFISIVGFSRSCVAQAYGRSGQNEAAHQAAVGIAIGIGFAVLLSLLSPLIELIPFLSNRPPAITQLESQFLFWAAQFGSVMVLNISLTSYFNGIGKTRITLIVGLIGQAVTVLATTGLVFGKFGLPELGMRGSALGTLAGTLVMLTCYLFQLPADVWRQLRIVCTGRDAMLGASIASRMKQGFSLGAYSGIDTLGSTVFVWIIGGLGASALAANNIDLTLNFIGTVPLIGLSIGCSVLCGNAIGEGDYARIGRILFVTLAIELFYVAAISFFEIFTPALLLAPFGLANWPADIQRASIATSQVIWMFSLAYMLSRTGSCVLESFGLTRFLFGARLVFMWFLSIPVVYAVAASHGGNTDFLPGCWMIGAFFEGMVGLAYFWRVAAAVKKRQNGIVLHTVAAEATESPEAVPL